jgi:hypothetical protein
MINGKIDQFTAPSYDFKNPVAVNIGFLRSQSFTNSHFHFPIILESVTYEALH